jgi:nitrate reductase alpha subunit
MSVCGNPKHSRGRKSRVSKPDDDELLAPLLPAGEPVERLLRGAQFFTVGTPTADFREVHRKGGRNAEEFYRERWRHDKEVRSTHGVNCTGSCSWKVYVKDGIITWETQQTDYPSTGPDSPEYEPRGCPRGASFSWYTYSPGRVRYPYVRGELLRLWREARARLQDPVAAWAEITADQEKSAAYKSARGQGGFVRSTWPEVTELIAAAHVHTIKDYGPDRIVGFSPIPAMSMVSYSAGTRFLSLIGGTILSFYDWYADMPIASPQAFGDQTDVPESGDWWSAAYLLVWGTNLPVTRTPDAHFMTEARYKGQKVVVVSPDYADHVKFADDWLPAAPGTDGALAMAMGHVILTEFFRDRQVPYFTDYVKTYTDAPFLVTLEQGAQQGAQQGTQGGWLPGKFLTAADLGDTTEGAQHKPVLLDAATGVPVVPNGTLGFRFGDAGLGRWNLELDGIDPVLTLHGRHTEAVTVDLPRFDTGPTEGGGSVRRGVPAIRVGGKLVTTVFDLLMAQYAVPRDGLPGEWPAGYDDAGTPGTPAWQQEITSVPAAAASRVAREFARNAELTRGRSMIAMGAGTNHWYHSDQIYRTFFTMIMLTGCQGVNGGGWAHYVGQEKVRPLGGFQHVAFAQDWQRPPRHMAGTSFFYLHTDQWRYEAFGPAELASPLGKGLFEGRSFADCVAKAARLGWSPSHPAFGRNPLDLFDESERVGQTPAGHIVSELRSGRLRFAADDPDDPANWPRVLTVWRANLLGSSGKGMEYFMRHLVGSGDAVRAEESPPSLRPEEVTWRDEAPRGKLDLHLRRHRAACRHLVREARPVLDRHAPVRPLVQPGDRAAVADADRLRRVPRHRPRLLPAVGNAPGQAHRHRGAPADARHPRRTRAAGRRGPRLGGRRVRSRARRDDAEDRHRGTRLPRGRGEDGRARPACRDGWHHRQGHHLEARQGSRLPARRQRCGARRPRACRKAGRRPPVAGQGRAPG